MKVKNVSARLHHIGNVFIAPGEEKEILDCFINSIDNNEIVEVKTDSVTPTQKQSALKREAKAATAAQEQATE